MVRLAIGSIALPCALSPVWNKQLLPIKCFRTCSHEFTTVELSKDRLKQTLQINLLAP